MANNSDLFNGLYAEPVYPQKTQNYLTETNEITNLNALYNQYRQDNLEARQLQMDREDSAYQRAVEDMRKAGLNPWLAMSSGGASTGSYNSASQGAMESMYQGLEFNSKENANKWTGMKNFVHLVFEFFGLVTDLMK